MSEFVWEEDIAVPAEDGDCEVTVNLYQKEYLFQLSGDLMGTGYIDLSEVEFDEEFSIKIRLATAKKKKKTAGVLSFIVKVLKVKTRKIYEIQKI